LNLLLWLILIILKLLLIQINWLANVALRFILL
jgi:hypothetical protein